MPKAEKAAGEVSPALVLFDIDGTLIRRAGPQHREALVEAVKRVAGLESTTDNIPVQGMLDRDILAIMMRAAVKDRVIPTSPCLDIKLPRIEPRSALVPITTETVLALRQAMPPRYRAFVTLGAGTGMRRGELLGLTLDRVAFEFATIRVDRQLSRASRSDAVMFGPPKTDSSTRTIPVAPVVLHTIREHVAEFGLHESGLVLTTETGSPVATSTIHAIWQRAARSVGADATPHALRHYFASIQIRSGQSVKVLQALLGHKSAVETWDTYGHLMGDEDDRSRSVIEEALGNVVHSRATVDPL